ncbi:MAG: hypothetical protein ACXW27_15140 [Allosphingosinicella sp.]
MAPKTSKADSRADGPVIDMADYGRALLRRRADYEARYGPLQMPRNSGKRRTPSKRALLKAIEEAGGKW